MNVSELRVGSWIHNPVQSIDIQVTLGVLQQVLYDEILNRWIDDRFQPIQLTEEWLLRFGFGKSNSGNGTQFKLGGIVLKAARMKPMNPPIVLSWYIPNIPAAKQIEFVHQIQNIYQSLKGDELTIKTGE